jgi:predicted  nucleic acid-binding Zn-ribbon protein
VTELEGKQVTIKNDNFSGLSRLCDKFRFRDFAAQLSRFRNSSNFKKEVVRVSALEERMDRLEALVGRVALPRSASEAATALEERMQQRNQEIAALQAEVSRLDPHVGALRRRRKL